MVREKTLWKNGENAGYQFHGTAASGLERILCGTLLKRNPGSMDRCTGRHNITELMMKTELNTNQSINHNHGHGPLNLYRIIPDLPTKTKPFENNVGKEENAGYLHFLLFPQGFPHFLTQILLYGRICLVVCKCFQLGPV